MWPEKSAADATSFWREQRSEVKIRIGCSCAVEVEGEVRLRGQGELEKMSRHGVVVVGENGDWEGVDM